MVGIDPQGVSQAPIASPKSNAIPLRWSGDEITPDAHRNGCANEATTGLTLRHVVVLFQDVAFG